MPENIGNISNLIGKKSSAPKPKPPSRIEVVERRVDTLEATLKTVVSELTALRSEVQRLRKSEAKATDTPKPTAKPQTDRKPSQPWDAPETLKAIKACRLRVLELFQERQEVSRQDCVDALEIPLKLASWTLAFMMQVSKEISLFTCEVTPTDPTPKKVFRLKT